MLTGDPRAAPGPREVGTTWADLSWQETKLARSTGCVSHYPGGAGRTPKVGSGTRAPAFPTRGLPSPSSLLRKVAGERDTFPKNKATC